MTQIALTEPRDIDAEPREVGHKALAQLHDALLTIEELLPATLNQVRSSYMTQLLDRSPSIDPDSMASAWEDSDAHGYTLRAFGAFLTARERFSAAAKEARPD